MFVVEDTLQTKYLIKYVCLGEQHRIVATDLVRIWTEEMSSEDIIRRCQELNPNIEAPPENLLSKVTNLMDSVGAEVRTNITVSKEMLCLSLETRVSRVLFRFNFRLSPSDPATFMQEVTVPLALMVKELQGRVTQLYEILKRKDVEIQQYKLEGAQICRKSVETEQFKKEEFEKQCLTKDHGNVKGPPAEVITEDIIQLWKSMKLSHATKIKDANPVKQEVQTNIKEEPASDDSDSTESNHLTRSNAADLTETHRELQIKREKDSSINNLNVGMTQKKVLKRKLRL
ncbi:non-homologous end-joining factor 1 [Schistocerca nitens]|uniref:non-homologous end-joining factor 1 n=1 Tax=Schistocerca nitens TaxID=7011 RepID=UPI0021179846|nr:non-homologous end-joining factor 1 [Schistocerca nitens]